MRNFARLLVLALVLIPSHAAQAQSSSPRGLYTSALGKERVIRRELERSKSPNAALLKRLRSLVNEYERMSRRFPASGYMDNALWQGALLSADAFWAFGETRDKTAALEMFSALRARFPTSSLVKDVAPHVKRLNSARPAPARDTRRAATAPARPATPSAPAAASAATLTSVRREVLADALRITLELAQEVPFRADRIDGPPRVFIDFDNTGTVDALKDATIPFGDDVVRQVRIGRQTDSRTRVVMDLAENTRHSVYTLYNPYRVVVDFARAAAVPSPDVAAANPAATTSPAPIVASSATPVASIEEAPPAVVANTPVTPIPPAANASGKFSLSRQLGLGVSRIVIDPGHGGHDPGAKAFGMTEAELVLDVALRLERLLQNQDGFEVVMTRRVDTFIPLEERTAIANREGADLFLSIHANASRNSAARGVETYFLNLTTNPEAEEVAARENAASGRSMSQLPDIVRAIALNNKIDESRDFASAVQASLFSQIQKVDRNVRNLGVKQAPFMVLLGATMPSVLAEISFITNRQDSALLKTDRHRQRIAEALYAGVVRYQESLKRVPAIAQQ